MDAARHNRPGATAIDGYPVERFVVPGVVVAVHDLADDQPITWAMVEPGLARLPVVVITGMGAPEDAQRAQELGATAFLPKPFSFDKQVELARQIRDNWLQPVRQAGKG